MQKRGENPCGLGQFHGIAGKFWLGAAHDDAAGVEVVVECLALAKEFGREQQPQVTAIFLVKAFAIANGDGALDDHHGIGVDIPHEVYDVLYVVGIEEILFRIIVRRCCNDYEICTLVGTCPIECSREAEFLFLEISLDVFVLNG